MPRNIGNPPKPKRSAGRPARYTPELAARICGLIATGSTLRAAAKACGVGWRTVARWNVERPEFRALYEQARETRTLIWGEQIIEIADDLKSDYRQDRHGKAVQNKESVLRSKLRIEARQWVMARLDPRLWGDRQEIRVNNDWTQLSEEERVRRALALIDLAKGAIEKKRLLEQGPAKIVYDPTDGDELADQEAARRRAEREQQEQEEGPRFRPVSLPKTDIG